MEAQRIELIAAINEAKVAGVSHHYACEIMGVSARTVQRWAHNKTGEDRRKTRVQNHPHQLTVEERQAIVDCANSPEYAALSPGQIVPRLADKDVYLASESSFFRVLKKSNQAAHRQASRVAQVRHKPKALTATAPNQVYSWDITYLKTSVKGVYYYLYLVLDIFSRKIVGWQVHEQESAEYAARLMDDIYRTEQLAGKSVVLHSDNGGPMKGATMLATLQTLGIAPSFSRPSVSNDNPYSEAFFRTLKYRPDFPECCFSDLAEARNWVMHFAAWYNEAHLHSGINFVTPGSRHREEDADILAKRHAVYTAARARNPSRWSGSVRKWDFVQEVVLNPEKGKMAG